MFGLKCSNSALYLQDICGDFQKNRLCDEFKERVFTELHSKLRNVTFADVDNKQFHFTGDDHRIHDGPPRYSIINFQKSNSSRVQYFVRPWLKVLYVISQAFLDVFPQQSPTPSCRNLEIFAKNTGGFFIFLLFPENSLSLF